MLAISGAISASIDPYVRGQNQNGIPALRKNGTNIRTFAVRLDADVADAIESIAQDLDWSNAKLISRLINNELPVLQTLQNRGDRGDLFAHLHRR